MEQLTSVRHHEVLIPVLCNGMKYEDLPPRLREGSAVPNLSNTKDYPVAGDEDYWKGVVGGIGSKICNCVLVGAPHSTFNTSLHFHFKRNLCILYETCIYIFIRYI